MTPFGVNLRLLTFAGHLAAARLLGYRVDRVDGRLLARASRVRLAHDAATARRARVEFARAVADERVIPHPFTGCNGHGGRRAG